MSVHLEVQFQPHLGLIYFALLCPASMPYGIVTVPISNGRDVELYIFNHQPH